MPYTHPGKTGQPWENTQTSRDPCSCQGAHSGPWHPILGVCLQLAPATTQASVADPRSCGCTHHWFHAPQPVLLLGPRGAAKDPNSHCSLWGLPAAFIKDHSVVDAIDVGNLNQRDHHRDPAPLLDPLPSHNLVTLHP